MVNVKLPAEPDASNWLNIEDVNSLAGFSRITTYLSSLEQITDVKPAYINAGQVSFVVELRGSAEGLAQTISLGNTLRKVAMTGGTGGMNNPQAPGMDSGVTEGYTYRLLP